MSRVEVVAGDPGVEPGVLVYNLRHRAAAGLPPAHVVQAEAVYAVRLFAAGTPADVAPAAVVIDFTDPAGPVTHVTGFGPQGDA
ncbi:hypothetical protein [Nocardioides nanhaiensis]|uniref:Uncharacterized protein n=1 Tax=Nocardioides nanhaiensis TaxID=1476871 RepID=A0ABP8W474_9ACTN